MTDARCAMTDTEGKNRIMIFGPKSDGTYVVEFRTAKGQVRQPLPQPKVGQCPSGYRESGGYCAPTSDRAPAAVPKVGQCPSGFVQSGVYCIETRRR